MLIEDFSKVSELAERAIDDGVVSVKMGELRAALGYGRLGPHVNREIWEALDEAGLATYPVNPDRFPTKQWEPIRVFSKKSKIGRIVRLLDAPFEDDAKTEANDRKIANLTREDEDAVALKRRIERAKRLLDGDP